MLRLYSINDNILLIGQGVLTQSALNEGLTDSPHDVPSCVNDQLYSFASINYILLRHKTVHECGLRGTDDTERITRA